MDKLKDDIEKVAVDLSQLDHDKMSVVEMKALEEKMTTLNDKFKQNLDHKEIKLRSVERFVNLFLPIRMQT